MTTANKSVISLKGSSDLVTEFLCTSPLRAPLSWSLSLCSFPVLVIIIIIDYATNTILFQRGIYPPDEFEQVKKYGLPLLVSKEKGVKTFIDKIMTQSGGKTSLIMNYNLYSRVGASGTRVKPV